MSNLEILNLCNVGLFAILCWRYQKKNGLGLKKVNQTSFILYLWLCSAICGFFYVGSNSLHIGQGVADYSSVLIVFGLFLLFIWPLLRASERTDDDYVYEDNPFLRYSCLIIAICSFLPFIENILHLFNGRTISEMGSYHDEMDFTVQNSSSHLSYLGKKFSIIVMWSKYIVPALFFNYLNKHNLRKNKFVIMGMLFAMFNGAINSFAQGSRFVAIQDISLYLFLYLFLRNTIDVDTRKSLVKYGSIFLSVLGLSVAIITLYRFGNPGDESVSDSLYRYMGEGFNNCYTDMMYINQHTYGANIFRQFLGVPVTELSLITGIRMHVYYTFVGDFLCDFNVIGTLIIFLVVSVFVYRQIINKSHLSVLGLLFLVLYAAVVATGYMYTSFMNVTEAFYAFFIYVFVYFIFKLSNKSKQ